MKAAIATGFSVVDKNVLGKDIGRGQRYTERKRTRVHGDSLLGMCLDSRDVRLLSGKTDYVCLPASGHPYVIGCDVCVEL